MVLDPVDLGRIPFGMARNQTPAPPSSEKGAAPGRPGTSGTENLLITTRRQASHNLQKAQRAERAYRAKKRAKAARQDYHGAAGHYKESLKHFKEGLKLTFAAIKSIPYIYGEKREARRLESDQKRKNRAVAKKKKLEERLARENDLDAESTMQAS